jgi:hypothetical protein
MEYYVIVSWAQYKTVERKGLVRLSDDWPKIVDLPYDEHYGLRLDVGGGYGL